MTVGATSCWWTNWRCLGSTNSFFLFCWGYSAYIWLIMFYQHGNWDNNPTFTNISKCYWLFCVLFHISWNNKPRWVDGINLDDTASIARSYHRLFTFITFASLWNGTTWTWAFTRQHVNNSCCWCPGSQLPHSHSLGKIYFLAGTYFIHCKATEQIGHGFKLFEFFKRNGSINGSVINLLRARVSPVWCLQWFINL